jgi:hypothetical protein
MVEAPWLLELGVLNSYRSMLQQMRYHSFHALVETILLNLLDPHSTLDDKNLK